MALVQAMMDSTNQRGNGWGDVISFWHLRGINLSSVGLVLFIIYYLFFIFWGGVTKLLMLFCPFYCHTMDIISPIKIVSNRVCF